MDSKTLHQQAAMIITYLLTLFMYLFVRLFAMLSLLSLCTYVSVCRGWGIVRIGVLVSLVSAFWQ